MFRKFAQRTGPQASRRDGPLVQIGHRGPTLPAVGHLVMGPASRSTRTREHQAVPSR